MKDVNLPDTQSVTLFELLDRILYKGVVVSGEVAISVADVDLIHLNFYLTLTSAQKVRDLMSEPDREQPI